MWHLLREDLTGSLVIPTTCPLPPSQSQCERSIDALARFHAAWWDDPRQASVGTFRSAATIGQNLRGVAMHFARFADRLGDELPRARRARYERLPDTPRRG
jgi:hypothetical protein